MAQHYSDPRRASDPHALPDIETFKKDDKWYFWYCFPGCMPDSDEFGPYDTEKEALADAQEDTEDNEAEADDYDPLDEMDRDGAAMEDADDEAYERWADRYDDLNGAPEDEEDR